MQSEVLDQQHTVYQINHIQSFTVHFDINAMYQPARNTLENDNASAANQPPQSFTISMFQPQLIIQILMQFEIRVCDSSPAKRLSEYSAQ